MQGQAYAPARGCDLRLNALCDHICPLRDAHGSLLARLDAAAGNPAPAWRCYAKEALSADGAKYAGGKSYCTRHNQLLAELQRCRQDPDASGHQRADPAMGASGATKAAAAVDAGGRTRQLGAEDVRPPPRPVEEWIRVPRWRLKPKPAPNYEHDARLVDLPAAVRIPRIDDCDASLLEGATFWAASLYTSSYSHKSERLKVSCNLWQVCCSTSLVPDGAYDGLPEGSHKLRHRLIASKPIFILRTLRASPLPLAWLDVDLEFHAFPTLFTRAGWDPQPVSADEGSGEAPDATRYVVPRGGSRADGHAARDVLLWNFQANVSHFNGRRLKTASGVMWFNKTDAAEALLTAWSEAMAYEPNAAAPDDQTLDLLVNEDGWIDRCAFGWLPAAYLRMMPRHKDIAPVLDHDRGVPVSGAGRNSPIHPTLPPHRV